MTQLTDLISKCQDVEEKAKEKYRSAFYPTECATSVSCYLEGAKSQSPIADALREAIEALEVIDSQTIECKMPEDTCVTCTAEMALEKVKAILEGKE